jgi:hypothetical protein
MELKLTAGIKGMTRMECKPGGPVATVTRIWVGPPENQNLCPSALCHYIQINTGNYPAYPAGTGCSFSGVKQLQNNNHSCSNDVQI